MIDQMVVSVGPYMFGQEPRKVRSQPIDERRGNRFAAEQQQPQRAQRRHRLVVQGEQTEQRRRALQVRHAVPDDLREVV